MRTTRNVFGLIFAALPVLYCGGFLLYFNSIRQWGGGWFDSSLGPTMLGLAAFGLLFLMLFLWKLRRYLRPPAPPRSGGPGGPGPDPDEALSDFDPDAAMARYLARRSNGVAVKPSAPFAPPVDRPPPGSFGRKGSFE